MKTLLITSSILLIISCHSSTIDINKEIKPILRSNWDSFIVSWENEDAKSCASLYMTDGINIPPSFKINKGRKEVEEFYNFLFNMNLSSTYKHDILDINGNINDIIEYGQFQVNWTRNDSTEWTYYARTMTHWVNKDGEWKINKFLFNNPPEENIVSDE